MDVTERYKDMIESFSYDFNLAVENPEGYSLDMIQQGIEERNDRLMQDIELLQELSFELRHGTIKILRE